MDKDARTPLSQLGIPSITLTGHQGEDRFMLSAMIDALEGPKSMKRDRPYSGQPHTSTGERGKTEIKGITFRDLRDAYIRAYIMSHERSVPGMLVDQEPNARLKEQAELGVNAQLNGNDVYDLKGSVDPMAVVQNLAIELEKLMGIYPNVPPLTYEGNED